MSDEHFVQLNAARDKNKYILHVLCTKNNIKKCIYCCFKLLFLLCSEKIDFQTQEGRGKVNRLIASWEM